MNSLQLSILDFGYINPPKLHAYQTVNSLLEEVGQYEEKGYKRLWLSEHYSPEFAWFNAEMLLPLLAGYSSKIKVGLAGVLLNYHSPLKVYQNFKMLSSLFPGRVDLGLARAGVPQYVNKALTGRDKQPPREGWQEKIDELFQWKNHSFEEDDPRKAIPVPPHGTGEPDTWMLGVSGSSIPNAVRYKSNFSVSMIHPSSSPEKNVDTLREYKQRFFDAHGYLPECSLVVSCICNDKHPNTVGDLLELEGEPNFVADQLHMIAEKYDTEEIVIYDRTLDRKERCNNLLQLAEVTNAVLI